MSDYREFSPQDVWVTPSLTVYGSVKEITQQSKEKTWGGGDDVMIDCQSILSDLGS